MAIKILGTMVIDNSRNITNAIDVTASGNINFTSTGSVKIPSGTTSQRPISPSTGEIRYNTDENSVEQYNGTTWSNITANSDLGGDPLLNIGAFSTQVTDLGSTSTSVSINVSTSSRYKITATGSISTWSLSGWPASGSEGIVQITLVNGSNLAAGDLDGVATGLMNLCPTTKGHGGDAYVNSSAILFTNEVLATATGSGNYMTFSVTYRTNS